MTARPISTCEPAPRGATAPTDPSIFRHFPTLNSLHNNVVRNNVTSIDHSKSLSPEESMDVDPVIGTCNQEGSAMGQFPKVMKTYPLPPTLHQCVLSLPHPHHLGHFPAGRISTAPPKVFKAQLNSLFLCLNSTPP